MQVKQMGVRALIGHFDQNDTLQSANEYTAMGPDTNQSQMDKLTATVKPENRASVECFDNGGRIVTYNGHTIDTVSAPKHYPKH